MATPQMADAEIGECMSAFYVALREGDVHKISCSVVDLEVLLLHSSEMQLPVVKEIVIECRTKALPLIRSNYADVVRNILSNCRKKSSNRSNAAVEDGERAASRHVNALMNMLGSWSNIVHELQETGLSGNYIWTVIRIFHNRIAEASWLCFEQFLDDYHINSLLKSSIDTCAGGGISPKISLHELDSYISQIISMLVMINQYLEYILGVVELELDCNSDADLQANESIFRKDLYSPFCNWSEVAFNHYRVLESQYVLAAYCQCLPSLLSTTDNSNKDAKLACCVAIDAAASTEAQVPGQCSLVCLQEDGNIYSLSCLEDAFFIARRVLGRLVLLPLWPVEISSAEDSVANACITHLLSCLLMYFEQPAPKHLSDLSVYSMFTSHKFLVFQGCYRHHQLQSSSVEEVVVDMSVKLENTQEDETVQTNTSAVLGSLGNTPPATVGGDLAIDLGVQLAEGVNQWLAMLDTDESAVTSKTKTSESNSAAESPDTDMTSTATTAIEQLPVYQFFKTTIASTSAVVNTITPPPSLTSIASSISSLTEELPVPLNGGSNTGHRDGSNGTNSLDSSSSSVSPEGTIEEASLTKASPSGTSTSTGPNNHMTLSLFDQSVYLSSLAVCVEGCRQCEELFGECVYVADLEEHHPHHHSLYLHLRRLSSCTVLYEDIFSKEVDSYIELYCNRQLGPLIKKSLKEYDFDGAEYDKRTHRVSTGSTNIQQSLLSHMNNSLISATGYATSQLKPGLSTSAYEQVLKHIFQFVAKSIFSEVLVNQFSEWGALLLQDEINQLKRLLVGMLEVDRQPIGGQAQPSGCMDSLDYLSSHCSGGSWGKLSWALKIITLDQPKDIQQYKITLVDADPVSQDTSDQFDDPSTQYSHCNVFNEQTIRQLFGCRTDFSREAVAKVPITVKYANTNVSNH